MAESASGARPRMIPSRILPEAGVCAPAWQAAPATAVRRSVRRLYLVISFSTSTILTHWQQLAGADRTWPRRTPTCAALSRRVRSSFEDQSRSGSGAEAGSVAGGETVEALGRQ